MIEKSGSILLEKSRSAAAAGQYIQPHQANVLDYAGHILESDSEHPEAHQFIIDVLEHSLKRAHDEIKTWNISQAKAFQDEAMVLANRHQLADAKIWNLSSKITAEENRQIYRCRRCGIGGRSFGNCENPATFGRDPNRLLRIWIHEALLRRSF